MSLLQEEEEEGRHAEAGHLKEQIRADFLSLSFYYFVRRGKWGRGMWEENKWTTTNSKNCSEGAEREGQGVYPAGIACRCLLLFLCAKHDYPTQPPSLLSWDQLHTEHFLWKSQRKLRFHMFHPELLTSHTPKPSPPSVLLGRRHQNASSCPGQKNRSSFWHSTHPVPPS